VWLPSVIALVFLAFHLPFLPASLEDVDSINFALGLRRFDVAHHQPHPPGYPLYIAAGKAVHAMGTDEAKALALVGVVSGAAAAFALFLGFRAVDRSHRCPPGTAIAATLIVITAPLYWFTAGRPLSDMAGLAAAVSLQAAALMVTSTDGLIATSFASGLAPGIRSQIVWLTVPLLMLVILRRCRPRMMNVHDVAWIARSAAAFVIGVLLWAVPLVVLSGGPAAYWRALFNEGAEDLGGIVMLWTSPTPRQLARALWSAFVAPWALPAVAAVVLVFALVGAVRLWKTSKSAVLTLIVSFGPYLAFDLLFQETATARYALPLVVPVAYLASRGIMTIGLVPAVTVIGALVMFNAHVGGTSIAAYAREKAPAFRLLDDMDAGAHDGPPSALAMDRREDLDLRRPMQWVGTHTVASAHRLAAPPQREWLEVVKYWNSPQGEGGRPVWFVADPARTDIDLVQHDDPIAYRWSMPYPVLIGGVRPNEMLWYRLSRPDWYVGAGWELTPEAAGVAQEDGRGLSSAPIEAWIAPEDLDDGALVIGGRNLMMPPTPAVLTIRSDGGESIADMRSPSGPFVEMVRLHRPARIDSSSPVEHPAARPYVKLSVAASPVGRVAIEQFDVSTSRPLVGFGAGWHEPEYDPMTGARWRWLSERGDLLVRAPRGAILHIAGESPLKYYSRPSRFIVRLGDRILADQQVHADFSVEVPLAADQMPLDPGTITIETDQTYVPAERSRRTADRRRLGLRIFKCELRRLAVPAS